MTCPSADARKMLSSSPSEDRGHHDLVAFVEPDVTPADLGRCDAIGLQRRAQRQAVLGHDQQVRPRRIVLARRLDLRRDEALVRRDGADELDLIVELEELRDRFAVAGAGGHFVDAHRVGGAVVGEEDDVIERAGRHHGDDRIAFAHARPLDRRQSADALDPAVRGQDDVGVLLDDERLGVEFELILRGAELRCGVVAVLLAQLVQLGLDDGPQLGASNSRIASISSACCFFSLQFVEDLLDLHLGDLVKLGIEDRVGLDLIELERLHQLLGGVGCALAFADQLDRLVERVEDDLEALRGCGCACLSTSSSYSKRLRTVSRRKSRK